ncbi:MAG TPA: homoserine O-acetyltransferase [Xanthobacteraceae bacterium]
MIVETKTKHFNVPLALECGRELSEFAIAYESYGELAPARDNVILVCHGLTADAHAAGTRTADDRRPGWWDAVIGPGKMLDTNHYCIVSSSVLGGCGGSTGPASIDPATGTPYAMRFPVVTVADMVRAQRLLLDRLGIRRLRAAIGGCLGGFQVLEWSRLFPHDIDRAIVISATHDTSAHTLALWHTLRSAIMADASWNGGNYYGGPSPLRGVGLSMQIAMLIWMDRAEFGRRFGRTLERDYSYGFGADFAAERFLDEIDASASARFDPNALLYLTRAMDYFDLTRGHASLAEALAPARASFLFVSYKADWRYPPQEMDLMCEALRINGVSAKHVVLDSRFGHGAFVYDPGSLVPHVRSFVGQPLVGRSLVEALLA